MLDINKLFDDKYNIVPCYIEKGFKNDNGMQLTIHVGNVKIGTYWLEFNADRSKSRTGGKAGYCMIIDKELERLISEKHVDFEIMGYVFALMNKTSWHTGVLKYRRKKKPIAFNDLMDIFGKGKTKTAQIVSKLKEYSILSHDGDGYKLSRSFIKKGGVKNA